MAKKEALHLVLVLSMKKEIDAVILKNDEENQAILDSRKKKIKYLIKIGRGKVPTFRSNE